MKILVTGANGYLGQGIVKAILDNENEVIASYFRTDYIDDRAKKWRVIFLKLRINMTLLIIQSFALRL